MYIYKYICIYIYIYIYIYISHLQNLKIITNSKTKSKFKCSLNKKDQRLEAISEILLRVIY